MALCCSCCGGFRLKANGSFVCAESAEIEQFTEPYSKLGLNVSHTFGLDDAALTVNLSASIEVGIPQAVECVLRNSFDGYMIE